MLATDERHLRNVKHLYVWCGMNIVLPTLPASWMGWKKGRGWRVRDDPGLKMEEGEPEQQLVKKLKEKTSYMKQGRDVLDIKFSCSE